VIQTVNDPVERTHRLTGMPRSEIVRRGIVRKEVPVYSAAGAIGARLLDPAASDLIRIANKVGFSA
jgi:hypothetical protein